MGTDNPADTVKDVSSASTDLTLIDYFAVVGLDRSLGLQYSSGKADCVDDISVTENITKPPLERSYVSSILAHFPDSRAGYPFPNEIVSLCMPKGLRFFTQKNVPSAAVHTFVNIREDGSRIHGCALIFYEEVSDSSLCDRMSELQTEHVRALTARDKNSDRTHIPPGTVSGGTHTLPRGRRKDRHKRASFYDASSGSRLFMSKCMCIISRIPIVSAGSRILEALYSIFSSPSQPPPLPLESYIYWALNEVPLPAPGSTLKVGLNGSDIILQRPGPSELPFFDYSLASLFKLISIDKFLRLFTCFLLEHQILLCSKFLSPLMLVAESLCALAFPFRWQLTYVPILPYSQLKFMEAPVPYIMGLCYEDALPDQIFQSNICVLDIDSGQLDMPEDVPPFPDKAEFGREITDVLDSVQLAGERNCSNEDLPKLRSQENTAVYEKEEWSSKRMSKSFDEDALSLILGGSSERKNSAIEVVTRGPPSKGNLVPLPLEDIFKQSEILARVTAIARKAGVSVPMDNIEKELLSNDNYTNSPVCRNYFQNVKINNAIREVFVNRFCWMLCSYEHFVIGGSFHDREMFFMSRDSIVNFDKAAFLSDQPQSHLAFLAAFLETQMFTSFIDLKILSQWDTPDENLRLFDQRIQLLNERHGLQVVRTPTYESALPSLSAEEAIAKREESLDYVVSQPHALAGAMHRCYDGTFPELNETLLEGSLTRSPVPSPWKQRHKRLRPKHQEILISSADHLKRSSAYLGGDPKQMAEQNWKFVQQLLKETKAKTKRMLVEKMGKEAVQLGHDEANVNGLEENTLVASFCDLLERIWAHGLIVKQGKSSLWAHVLHHQEDEKLQGISSARILSANASITPDFAPYWTGSVSADNTPECSPRKRSLSRPHSPESRQYFQPLPTHIAYDLKNVLRMTEIKTDIGYARAFVRLALERKLLHKHIKTILNNTTLLQKLYRGYAFLRCDDEKEQFLYHILSLNTAEFRCFTNTFTKTEMRYRVVLVTSGSRSLASCSLWFQLAGSLGTTLPIEIKQGVQDFTFEQKNLGILSTLRIGQKQTPGGHSTLSKWFLGHVMVRSEVTGQTYRFNCGRWFGRGVDDGSLERLLVAEVLPQVDPDTNATSQLSNSLGHGRSSSKARSRSPPHGRSSSMPRPESYGTKSKARLIEIQQELGEAVNAIVKHFYSGQEARRELTQLLCAPDKGLVSVMISVFMFGRQDSMWSGRFFKQNYPWDYVEKVCFWFHDLIRMEDAKRLTREQRSLIAYACRLVRRISSFSTLGKDGKFQLFVIITIRDHTLSGLLSLMAWTPVTSQLYDEPSFLRTPHYLSYISKLLSSLNEFQFNLESSLTYDIDQSK